MKVKSYNPMNNFIDWWIWTMWPVLSYEIFPSRQSAHGRTWETDGKIARLLITANSDISFIKWYVSLYLNEISLRTKVAKTANTHWVKERTKQSEGKKEGAKDSLPILSQSLFWLRCGKIIQIFNVGRVESCCCCSLKIVVVVIFSET